MPPKYISYIHLLLSISSATIWVPAVCYSKLLEITVVIPLEGVRKTAAGEERE